MNTCKKLSALMLCAVLIAANMGCSQETTTTVEVNADTKADVKTMTETFYAGLADSNPVELTSQLDGEVTNIFTRAGTSMKIDDKANGIVFYLFEENGKKYFLDENGTLTEEEYTYDFYANTINLSLTFLLTGYLQGDEQEEGIKYAASQKDVTQDGVTDSELSVTITAEEGGKTATITTVGTKKNDKVTHITTTMSSGETETKHDLDFKYDNITIELPEYEIIDYTEFYSVIESPYATLADARADAGEADLYYASYGDIVYTYTRKDGKYLQLAADIPEDVMAAYSALDVMNDDYSDQVHKLLDPLPVTECIDFSGFVLTDEEIENYKGKTLSVLMEEGFEQTGYSVWEEGANVYLDKNGITYETSITLPEGFDTEAEFEFEDLLGSTVNNMVYSDVNSSLFPLK